MAENMAFECVKNERKSKVWIFFLLNKEERKAKCISCSQMIMIAKDGSTSNLLNHLRANHSADFKWIKGNKNEKTKSSDKSKKFQPMIIDIMSLADKTENFEKRTSSKNDENVSVSNVNNKVQMTQVNKETIPESDQIRETLERPNVAIGISKKRKNFKCKYCSNGFNSKVKFEVHRKYCKVYHISYHKFIGKCNDGFKCKVCYFKHLDRDEMLEHVKKKHRNDRLYNGIDGQNLTHVAGNRIRIISVSKKLCEYCFEEFKSNDWHFENLCQDSCKLYSEFIEVVTNQKQPKNFKCKLCGHNKDQGRKEIYKHIRTEHTKEINSKRFETSNHEKEKVSHSLHTLNLFL